MEKEKRSWSTEQVDYIKVIGSILSDAFAKRKAEITLRDINEKLKHMAHYDKLTGLPNRRLFFELLRQAVYEAERNQQRMAVMFIDLDNFKAVNDTYGHDVGDGLLRSIGHSIVDCLRKSDTVARLGGDEFSVVLRNISNQEDLINIAEKILAALNKPMIVQGNICHSGASIGIAVYPDDGDNAETILSNADKAMYKVKQRRKGNYQFA